VNHEEEKERLRWEGFAENEGFKTKFGPRVGGGQFMNFFEIFPNGKFP